MSIDTTNPVVDITDRSTRQLGQAKVTDLSQQEYLSQLVNEAKRIHLLLEEVLDTMGTYPSVQSTAPTGDLQEGQVWVDNSVIAPWETKVYDKTGPLSYSQQVMADSPLAYWKLNDPVGSTLAADSSNGGHPLSLAGGTVNYGTAGGPVGTDTYATFVAATNASLTATGTSWLPTGNVPYTLEAWCNIISNNVVAGLVAMGAQGTAGQGAGLLLFNMDLVDHSNSGTDLRGIGTFYKQWHHFVITYDGVTSYIYVDGVLVNSGAWTANIGVGTVTVGSWNATNFLQGGLAHVAIYKTALSAARVLAHARSALTVSGPGWIHANSSAIDTSQITSGYLPPKRGGLGFDSSNQPPYLVLATQSFINSSGISFRSLTTNDLPSITTPTVTLTNSLTKASSTTTMNSATAFVDGPTVSCVAGTWLLLAQCTVLCGTSAGKITGKLWDGTTVITSGEMAQVASATSSLSLIGVVTPGSTTTYKMSVATTTGATSASTLEATCVDNSTGTTSTATWINAVRIA